MLVFFKSGVTSYPKESTATKNIIKVIHALFIYIHVTGNILVSSKDTIGFPLCFPLNLVQATSLCRGKLLYLCLFTKVMTKN